VNLDPMGLFDNVISSRNYIEPRTQSAIISMYARVFLSGLTFSQENQMSTMWHRFQERYRNASA
jgi:hypothetical protein